MNMAFQKALQCGVEVVGIGPPRLARHSVASLHARSVGPPTPGLMSMAQNGSIDSPGGRANHDKVTSTAQVSCAASSEAVRAGSPHA